MELSTAIGLMRAMQRGAAAGPLPPAAQGTLPDRAIATGVPMEPADLSEGFTGTGLSFALAPGSDALPAGLSLAAAGVLSGTPGAEAGPLNVVIRASNAQGNADSGFSLTVQDVLLDFTASIDGLTDNPAHGFSAQTGVPLTAVASGFPGAEPSVITYQWKTAESGAIAGATDPGFTPDAALYDGETLSCTIAPEGYPAKDTPGCVIRQTPPVAAGALADEIFDIDSGPQTVGAGADFTGAALAFSVAGPGCSIDTASGQVTVRTDSQTAGAVVTVTALNTGGAALSVFQLTVEDPAAGPGPDLSAPVLDDAAGTISLAASEPCTVYWRRDPTGTNADAGDVIAGGGLDSGSFAVSAGANTVDITFAQGNDGVQEISFVAAVITDEPSLVRTVAIEIDTAGPAVIDTDFGPGFTTGQAALWASIQANSYNSTPAHLPGETWASYPATVTDGGVVASKTGNYPQIRFSVPVETGKTYSVDADLPVGEGGSWSGPLKLKLGAAINGSDYAEIDETQTGQPRVVDLRGLTFQAVSDEVWIAIIVQTSVGGTNGGDPAIAMLRIQEV